MTLEGRPPLKVTEMEVFLGEAETFVVYGDSLSLAGVLPESVGYEEDFSKLLGKTLEVPSSSIHGGQMIEPNLILGGGKVLLESGTLQIEKVTPNPNGAGAYLEGTVNLNSKNGESFTGRFSILAKTYG